MKVLTTDNEVLEISPAATFCGIGFKEVTFTLKDFDLILSAPDLRNEIERLACRMVPEEE